MKNAQGKERFTASRKQIHRMAAIVALLKKREWVKMREIVRTLDRTEFETGAYLACCNRTIQRDIRVLKEEYQAPVEYSKKEAAYTLTDKEWSFQVPALLNADELLAVMLGGKISLDLFPECISARVRRAVDEILRYNESEAITEELMDSLKVLLPGSAVPSEIFETVFEAWRSRRLLRISYMDEDGQRTLRDIEPHALVFHEMRWSVKGVCRLRKDVRTFHVSGMLAVQLLEQTFKPSPAIIASVTPDGFLDYGRERNVVIRLNPAGRQFASLHVLHSGQSFALGDDGFFIMNVPSVPLELLVPWILRQQGNAEPLSPPAAVEAVKAAVRRLADVCRIL